MRTRIFSFFNIAVLLLVILSGCSKSDTLNSSSPGSTGNENGSGTGGSMARFTISGNNLYTVNDQSMIIFDITNPAEPVTGQTVNIGTGIETIYPYKNNLFIGSQNGMFIYDNTNPAAPKFLSNYSHITSCDPVVVSGNYAYVTLRTATTNNRCNRGVNQLDVIDISNLRAPQLVKSYNMTQPYGLGVDSSTLFVCDDGLKVFNAANPLDLKLTNHFTNVASYDVIPKNNTLMLIGSDGLYQYDYSNRDELKLLSKLMIEK